MDTLIKFLVNNPALLTTLIAAVVLSLLSIILIFVVAFIQGREVSFYPPKIGAKLDKTDLSGKKGLFSTVEIVDRAGFSIPIQKRLENAQTVYIMGLNLVNFVTQYQTIIESKALAGCKFKILTLSTDIFQHQELFPGWHGSLRRKDDLEYSLKTIEHLLNKSGNIQIRFLAFPPPFSLFIINPERPDGEIQVELYTYEDDPNKRPHFVLKNPPNEKWFNYFRAEFEQAWENAKVKSSS
jgi:hypothetical protein